MIPPSLMKRFPLIGEEGGPRPTCPELFKSIAGLWRVCFSYIYIINVHIIYKHIIHIYTHTHIIEYIFHFHSHVCLYPCDFIYHGNRVVCLGYYICFFFPPPYIYIPLPLHVLPRQQHISLSRYFFIFISQSYLLYVCTHGASQES